MVPALATGLFYLLPPSHQRLTVLQLAPQILAYLAFGLWIAKNHGILDRLGLKLDRLRRGAGWGLAVGTTLGLCNSYMILIVIPGLGLDILFLTETPHARIPVALMIPWGIFGIAVLVEINFRGFQLGRWVALLGAGGPPPIKAAGPVLAVATSSVLFAFDPFLVTTFRHLHWIAIWDGVIWGLMWLRLRTLYATIVAHAVEVMIMYSIIRSVLA